LTWLLGLDVLGLGLSAVCPVAAGLQILLFVWFFIHFLVLTPAVTAMEAA
jgi:ubiquinol-cytochrome c reductase cytochrome b subunit